MQLRRFILLVPIAVFGACGAEPFHGLVDAGGGGVSDNDANDSTVSDAEPEQDVPAEMPPPLLANGAACASAELCSSGFCADGVCCDSACDGLCLSCTLGSQSGTCTPLAAGSDPGNECAEEDTATCGRDGFCDGAGHCALYPTGTTCGAAVCAQAMFTAAATCDGAGVCQKTATVGCGKFACASAVACRANCLINTDCLTPNACLGGVCGGVTGHYFNTVDFNSPVLTRIDPNIDFDWMTGSPDPKVVSDLFSVRWTGTLTAKYSETYTFYIGSSDGERLFLDNVAVINNFVDHVATPEDTGTRALQAGQAYQLRLEYYERYSNASIKLSWSSPSQPKEIIPTGAFSPM